MKNIFKKMVLLFALTTLTLGMTACASNEKIKDDDNKIVIGFDNTFVPMGFLDEEGNTVGFDVDLAKEVFKRIGMDIKFQAIDWSMKETELNSGNVDVLWNGYSLSPEREKIVSYSKPYLKNRQIIVTMANSKISTKKDLVGKELGTQQESTAQTAVEKDSEFVDSLKGKAPILYDTYDKALRDLEIGRTSAVAGDEVLIRYYMSQKGEEKYKVLKEDFGVEDYVVAFSKDNTELRDKVNDALEEIKEDKTFNKIYDKWFK